MTTLDAADLWDRPDRVILKPEVIDVSLNISVNDISGENLGKLLAEIFYVKLHRGDQFNHTLVYVNSTSQVPEVVEALNELGIAAEGLIGETPKEEREAILDRFAAGMTRVLVNVGVVGEGFDVPSVETVVLAFESESRTRVVQAIGRAMRLDAASPNKQALVVDLGGNTQRHRLSIQIREAYEAEGIQLKGTQNGNGNGGLKQRPQAEAVIGDIAELIFRGEKPTTKFIEETFAVLKLSASDIQKAAYHLGIPSDILFAYANGLRVPPSLTEVINIAREVGDQHGLLHEAWAKEKAAQMEITDPLLADLGPAGRAWARHLRWGLWYKYEGVVTRVPNVGTEAIRNWLKGKFEIKSTEIWEETIQRQLLNLTISDGKRESLRLLNEYLAEKGYPLFEPWMENADKKSILIHRLKQLAKKLDQAPTQKEVDAEPGMASVATYMNQFGSFNKALKAAGLMMNRFYNKTREELIADLKALAKRLGRSPTGAEVNAEPGIASNTTYAKEFGSFNQALKAAGLTPTRILTNKTRKELITDLKTLAKRLSRSPTGDEVNAEPGMASMSPYAKEFGGFNKALIAAGLTPTRILTNKTREELITDLQALAKRLGHSPTQREVNAEPEIASEGTYAKEFGSFNQALIAAGLPTRKSGQKK